MQFWNTIVNTALLGTDKKMPAINEFPDELSMAANTALANTTLDREEQFLHTAALAFNYRQSGVTALQKVGVSISLCPEEVFPYCALKEMQVLSRVLDIESCALLEYWLKYCTTLQRIVTPEFIPLLLNKAIQHKSLREMITACCGNRGNWLSKFNPDWQLSATSSPEELWQTGTLAQRYQVLLQLRTTDPALALSWLQQTWNQENAATKQELLQAIAVNSSLADEAWLQTLVHEKSKLVKTQALDLLKCIPGSALLEQYWQTVSPAIQVKKIKNSLGIPTKKALHFEPLQDTPEDIFKSGIEKLSNDKTFTDDELIVYQLIQYIPLQKWEQHFQLSPEEIIGLFQQATTFKKYLPAFINAILRFKNKEWALSFVQHCDTFYIDLIPLLPLQQQELYSTKYFHQYPDRILNQVCERKEEWSMELAQAIFNHTSKNPYQYNRHFYGELIHLIPAGITDVLDTYTNEDEYSQRMWTGIAVHVLKLVSLKKEIQKTFNA